MKLVAETEKEMAVVSSGGGGGSDGVADRSSRLMMMQLGVPSMRDAAQKLPASPRTPVPELLAPVLRPTHGTLSLSGLSNLAREVLGYLAPPEVLEYSVPSSGMIPVV